jgi:hypothetical protein
MPRKIVEIVCSRIPAQFGLDPIREVQVLCPMNRGRIGAGHPTSIFKPRSTVMRASLRWSVSAVPSEAVTK